MPISDRTALLMLAGMLSACGGAADQRAGEPVACRTGGSGGFAPLCTMEWAGQMASGEPVLVIHHPDGGFRRFVPTADGRISAADGAEPAKMARIGKGVILLRVGADEYRIEMDRLKR